MTSPSKGWTTVAFGDVVKLNKERVQDPLSEGLDRYVGLEHLEPGELKIRRWGNVADGTTFTSVFRPGQVLFGKRRAYQRKVAVADFSGVCSGDIYVLTPKDDRLLPELLPFICRTDSFFDHAIGTSAGSLSPRTNWKSLAGYEFPLPPLDEQCRLAEALQALTDAAESQIVSRERANSVWLSSAASALQYDTKEMPVGDAFQVQIGRQRAPRYTSNGNPCPYLRAANVKDGHLVLDDVLEMDFDSKDRERFRLETGDVLITEGCGSPEELGASARWDGEIAGDVCFQNTLIRLRPRSGVTTSEFAYVWARLAHKSGQFLRIAHGSNILHIGSKRLEGMRTRVPPLDRQKELAVLLEELEAASESFNQRSIVLDSLARQLLDQQIGS